MLTLDLPYPPSVNHYWRMARGRWYISAEGKRYRAAVLAEARDRAFSLAAPLRVDVALTMPDKRRRDVDNVLKALLDALQYAGVYADDSQIEELHVVKVGLAKPGGVRVTIEETER